MKRKLLMLCALALALCLATGLAQAQTRREVCSELGVCDYADFADWSAETVVNGADKVCVPFPEEFDSDAGMTLWQLPVEAFVDRYDGEVVRFPLYHWFAAEGLLSQVNFDLDGDGQDEWLALCVRQDEPDEYDYQAQELRLRVYEVDGEEVELADELCLDHTLDYIEHARVDLLRVQGQTLLAYQALNRVDSPWTILWLLAYENGKFHVRAGFERALSSDLNDWLCVHGAEADAHGLNAYDHDGEDGGGYVEGDMAHYREALNAVPKAARLLNAALSPMGGTSILEDYPRIYELSGLMLNLLDLDTTADAPDGTPVVAIRFLGMDAVCATASVNLRAEPSLEDEKLGSITKGTHLHWLGERHTDERGVDWYRVEYQGRPAWISSRYAELP